MVIRSITLIIVGEGLSPPAFTILVEFEAPVELATTCCVSPKFVAFPCVAIVTKSIVFVAPFDGVISKIHKPAGEIVQSAELIAEFDKVSDQSTDSKASVDDKEELPDDTIISL